MDQLPAFGSAIATSLVPTFKTYAPLHEKNRANIESTPRDEFKYGSDPRQKLDLYTPKQVSDDTPVMVFVYGGGLSRGDRRLPSPPTAEGLVYANIGHYYSVSVACWACQKQRADRLAVPRFHHGGTRL